MRTKKSVLVVTSTRAEYGLLRPVMRELQKSTKLSLKVLVTGMHTLKRYDFTGKEVRRDGMPIAAEVTISEKDSMTDALAKEIRGIGRYCTEHRPDLILVLGDIDGSFAGAIVGGHFGIPVAHIHGGDKTGPVVDEYIRHAITKFSHLHFPATRLSARRIKLLGEEPWRIAVTGAPGLDELRSFKTDSVQTIAARYGLSKDTPWFVMLLNPTPLDTTPYREQVVPLLECVTKLKGEKIILCPNADTGSDVFMKEIHAYARKPNVHFFSHIPRIDLVAILKRAELLVGNSSMGIIDASYLRLPTVDVGNRQEGRERGANVIHANYDATSIRRAIKKATSSAFRRHVATMKSLYGDGRSAERIVKQIERHIDRKDLFYKKLTYV